MNFDEESGMKHPAYHLRPNKAVDRLLWLNVLDALSSEERKNSTYYSLSGPFLEDLHIVHLIYPEIKLVAIEQDLDTHLRQKFHQFSRVVELRHQKLGNFVSDFPSEEDSETRDILWLDFTDFQPKNFTEFCSIIGQAKFGTIVRVTLPAKPDLDNQTIKKLGEVTGINDVLDRLKDSFKEKYQKFYPHSIDPNLLEGGKPYAIMVQMMIRLAAEIGLKGYENKIFQPLQTIFYSDGTQMLSVAGIICEETKQPSVQQQFQHIRFANFDWKEPQQINIPTLSLKERLHFASLLPVADGKDAGTILHQALGYTIDRNEETSKKQLSAYAEYYREYPNFIKAVM
jgi:hypothetical protein